MSPANLGPVETMSGERHLDLQADLHVFADTLFTDKSILDVGAGLGKSKARMRHNRVTTYDPSEDCRGFVDVCGEPPAAVNHHIVTAFDVIEHVQDDVAFLRYCDGLATEAILITTPNWLVNECRSRHHYREYMHEELAALLDRVFTGLYQLRWFVYRKDAEGGWVDPLLPDVARTSQHLKHVVLIDKSLPYEDARRIDLMYSSLRWAR